MWTHKLNQVVGIALILWAAAQAFIVVRQIRFPGPDVFQFKAAGRQFSQDGRFSVRNLPNSPRDEYVVYSFYPPLYPFLYGAWSTLFGQDYGSSVLFDSLQRLIRGLVIFWLVCWLVGKPPSRWSNRFLIGTVAVLWISTFVPNNEDRPDDLGLWLALTSMLCARKDRLALSGTLLGLAGAASPTAGVFGAMAHCVFEVPKLFVSRRLWIIGAISAIVFAGISAPLVLYDPGIIDRFLKGVHYNALPYANRSAHARMSHTGLSAFWFHLKLSMAMGKAVFWCTGSLTLCGLILAFRSRLTAIEKRLLCLSLLFSAFSLFVFSVEPLYLWFSACVLLALILSRAASQPWLFAVIVVSFGLMLVREGKLVIDGIIREESQTLRGVQKYLTEVLEPSARVVLHSDSFFSVPYGQADNVAFICDHVHQTYDYAWTTESVTFQNVKSRTPAQQKTGLCFWRPHCFELVSDRRSTQVLKLFGIALPYYVRGFGGVLYRNQCRLTGVVPPW